MCLLVTCPVHSGALIISKKVLRLQSLVECNICVHYTAMAHNVPTTAQTSGVLRD